VTLQDLINEIAASGSAAATVHTVALGNPGGAGNYRVVTIVVGERAYRFRETPGGWKIEPPPVAVA
jgi:hypothetical protein